MSSNIYIILNTFQNIYIYNVFVKLAFCYSSHTFRSLTVNLIWFLSFSQKHIWYLFGWRKPQACTPSPARCTCSRLKPMLNQSSTARWSTSCQKTKPYTRTLINSTSHCSVSQTHTHLQKNSNPCLMRQLYVSNSSSCALLQSDSTENVYFKVKNQGPIKEGDDVEMMCETDGNPQPEFEFTKEVRGHVICTVNHNQMI